MGAVSVLANAVYLSPAGDVCNAHGPENPDMPIIIRNISPIGTIGLVP